MKRLPMLVVIVAFLAAMLPLCALTSAATAASAAPPPAPAPPADCHQINDSPTTWPNDTHSYYCGTANQNDEQTQKMLSVLNESLGSLPWAAGQVSDLATNNRANFYIYGTEAEFASDFPSAETPPAGAGGETVLNATNEQPEYTAIFEVDKAGAINPIIGATTAHELGHWFDYVDSSVIASNGELVTLGGTVTAGNTITIDVHNSLLSPNPEPVTYKVKSGDSLTSIATGIAAAINADAKLKAISVTATSSSLYVNIEALSTKATTYTHSLSSGATLSVTYFGSDGQASSSKLFYDELNNGDYVFFNAAADCVTSGAGVFNQQLDDNDKEICNSIEPATIGGTPHAGDIVKVTITDPALSPNPGSASYTVKSGDTTTLVASGLAKAINNQSNFKAHFITATSSGATVSIAVGTGNQTTYAGSVSGTQSESITLPNPAGTYGKGNEFSLGYAGINSVVLTQEVWLTLESNAEMYAEENSDILYSDRSYDSGPNAGSTNYQSLDWYLDHPIPIGFQCINKLETTVGKTGVLPTSYPSGCPAS